VDEAGKGFVAIAAEETVPGVRDYVGGGDRNVGPEIDPVRVRLVVLPGQRRIVHTVIGPVGAGKSGDGPPGMIGHVTDIGGKE
jgi:hypothetical protein